MSRIEVQNVSYEISDKKIIDNVSTSFNEKSLTCVLGPNGAGKTSLIKCICGLVKFRGSISINDKSISEMDSKSLAREVSYVPQSITSDLNFTVEEFILLSRYPWQGVSDITQNKVDELLEITGLKNHRSQLMSTLSGGERQRALICAALVQDSQIILLDEITSALDPRHQDQIVQLLLKIKDQGKTLIWATHDVNEALLYADKLLAMKEGKVFSYNIPEEFIAHDTLEKLYERSFSKMEHPIHKKTLLI